MCNLKNLQELNRWWHPFAKLSDGSLIFYGERKGQRRKFNGLMRKIKNFSNP